jgi:hypothetical protein
MKRLDQQLRIDEKHTEAEIERDGRQLVQHSFIESRWIISDQALAKRRREDHLQNVRKPFGEAGQMAWTRCGKECFSNDGCKLEGVNEGGNHQYGIETFSMSK